MTKDQEREVLRQIIELISSTDADGYIQTAFTGCVRDAERNIDEDAAFSWYDRAQSAERKAAEAQAVAKEAREAYENLKKRTEQKQAENETVINNLRGALKTAEDAAREHWNNFRKKEDEADALRQQVTELKAKLYDFMIKG